MVVPKSLFFIASSSYKKNTKIFFKKGKSLYLKYAMRFICNQGALLDCNKTPRCNQGVRMTP